MCKQLATLILMSILTFFWACQNSDPDIFVPIFETYDASPEATTLVIKRLSDDKVWISNIERAEARYIPASTSKIPHTLIALETNLATPETFFKWDGRERAFKAWNQDQTLAQAYKRSAVWVYQELTQALGPDVMTSWLSKFQYGNFDVGDVDNITEYWLTGPLQISALEQVSFLEKLSKRQLLVSAETYEKALPIFKNEMTGTHTLYAKTGWMYDEEAMDIGWFVGWVDLDETSETYVFALNMNMPNQGDNKKRKPIVMKALKEIGAWPK